MKNRRFYSLFLIVSLISSLLLSTGVSAQEEYEANAEAAILVEAATGEILYEKNMHQKQYPASITKVMTALLVLEAVERGELSLSDSISASSSALKGLPHDGSSAGIKVGEVLSVEQLLNCVLIVSANEGCNILAEAVSGDIATFVEQMNKRADELGCKNTHFVNANGLHDEEHYTSAYDIWLIAQECIKYDLFLSICGSKSAEIPATNLSDARTLHSTNALISNWNRIGYLYRYAKGLKTGSTSEAGFCLLSLAEKDGRKLVSVVLGAKQLPRESDGKMRIMSFDETARLFDYGFDNFSRKKIVTTEEAICEVPVNLSSEANYVVVHPAVTLERMLPNDLSPDALERSITLHSESADAPIAAGDELGEMTLSYNGDVYGTVPLLALSNVSASWILLAKRTVGEFFARPLAKLILVVLIILLLLVLVLLLRARRASRRRYRRKRYSAAGNYRGRR